MKLLRHLALPALCAATLAPLRAAERPNVLFILTDDLGWGDAGAFGHPYWQTPNLDRLARESTRFTQFYVANPVCSPSRTGFMTGQYPARWRVDGHFDTPERNAARNMPNWLDPRAPFLPRLLHEAGYTTAHFGKWHLGHSPDAPTPGAYGLDVHATVDGSGPRLGAAEIDRHLAAHPGKKPDGTINEEVIPFYRAKSTRMIVDETLTFLREHRNGPFYVNVWTLLPHAPLRPTPEQLAPWQALDPRPEAYGSWMRDYAAAAKNLRSQSQVYAASMSDLDTQIGRLLDGLRELGLDRNTIVVFSSDNGPEDYRIGNARNAGVGSPGPFRARKRSLYEGGIRTPLLVRWPGHVAAGATDNSAVIGAVDLLPTVCALAGVKLSADCKPDGEDVGDIWLGKSRARRGPLFWEWRFRVIQPDYTPPRYAMRDGDWKLFTDADRRHVELYDIVRDPEERTNVAASHPDVVDRLSTHLLGWARELPSAALSPATPPAPPAAVPPKPVRPDQAVHSNQHP